MGQLYPIEFEIKNNDEATHPLLTYNNFSKFERMLPFTLPYATN